MLLKIIYVIRFDKGASSVCKKKIAKRLLDDASMLYTSA